MSLHNRTHNSDPKWGPWIWFEFLEYWIVLKVREGFKEGLSYQMFGMWKVRVIGSSSY